jgi:hypothetical protein
MEKEISVDFTVDEYIEIQNLAQATGRDVKTTINLAVTHYKNAAAANIEKGGWNPLKKTA